ncbi:MAG: WG repeat-containing protein, partial [Bacteroidales bacterium]|nr:WG repeat-containing protein [Bacteroidales bacterium]
VDDGINGIFAIDRNEKKLFSVYIIDNGPDEIKSGLFRITENDKIGFADFNGDIIIKPKYEFVFPFVGGIAPFCEGCYLLSDTVTHEYTYYAGGKWGLINRQGIIVYKPQFDSISFDKKGNRYLLYVSDEAFLLNGKLELIKFTRE